MHKAKYIISFTQLLATKKSPSNFRIFTLSLTIRSPELPEHPTSYCTRKPPLCCSRFNRSYLPIAMAESSSWGSSPEATTTLGGMKRSSTVAGNTQASSFRAIKRRASKACQCCRARKVRCNVVEHGAPCTNCRLDEVECIITESKRRK